jgi:predicted Zn-dependent peptidase
MEENVLKNGTVYTILAIGEEATDETRLSTLMSRIAGILRLGKYNEPFPYMNERIMAALRTSGPLAIQNGNAYVLTEKGLRLYYAIIDALYDAKGREVVRKVLEARKVGKKRKKTKALERDAVVPH